MNTGTKVTTGATATTHDIDIELPEPAFTAGTKIGTTTGFFCRDSKIKKGDGAYTREQVIAAIEADRKRRGEPVAWMQRSYLNQIRESNVALHNVVVRGSKLGGDGDVVPLYTVPQPSEPVKEPSDIGEVIKRLQEADKPLIQQGKFSDVRELLREAAALLARYG